MDKYNYYVVSTINEKTVERHIYYEDGHSAQEVVDRVRGYISEDETITNVYKEIKSWK